MKKRTFFILLASCAISGSPVWGQLNWTQIVPAAFVQLDQEVQDSISFRRAESLEIRTEMNVLMVKLGYEKDRVLIFGPDDIYFKEGMHLRFSSAPRALQLELKRDPNQVRLETLHGHLYHSDKAIYRWLDLEQKLQKHSDRLKSYRWAMQYRDLIPESKSVIGNEIDAQKWVAQDIVCGFAADILPQRERLRENKIRDFNPKFKEPAPDSAWMKSKHEWKFPFDVSSILFSLPMNGQFSFWRDEYKQGVGYVYFPQESSGPIYNRAYGNNIWKARWTSEDGKTVLTDAKQENGHILFFNLPDAFFQPETVYKIELLVIPVAEESLRLSNEDCWKVFRGLSAPANLDGLEGAETIVSYFFRTGKYSVLEKMETLNGYADVPNGVVYYETDEPFDPMEIRGGQQFEPTVRFSIFTASISDYRNALDDKELYYYLTVPQVENLEGKPLAEYAIAELDNTAQASFVRNMSKGGNNEYNIPPDHNLRAFELPGGYLAPALSKSIAPDTLAGNEAIPFIGKQHFEAGKIPNPGMTKCTLFVGELKQLLDAVNLHKEQIRKRMEERAMFFYQLEKRKAQRAGKQLVVTLESLQQQELENMPPKVKLIYNTDYLKLLQSNLTINYRRYYPGTVNHFTAELLIGLNK